MLVKSEDVRFVVASLSTLETAKSGANRSHTAASLAVLAAVCLYSFVSWLSRPLQYCLLAWVLVELIFYMSFTYRLAVVNERVDVPLDSARVREIKARFLKLAGVFSLEEFLSGWFLGTPAESIWRGNAEDFVAYGFFCRPMAELPFESQQEVQAMVADVENAWGVRLPEGRNPDIAFMAHTWEDLRVLPTPLFVHLLSEGINVVCSLTLHMLGFRSMTCLGVHYWMRIARTGGIVEGVSCMEDAEMHLDGSVHRRGDSASSVSGASVAARPLVFLHGVGLGLLPYMGLLMQIGRACAGTSMIVIDVPHVSMRLGRRAKEVDNIAAAANAILCRHGYANACFAGHSFGTFCVSRICQLYPGAVDSVVLMDPVCMLTCYPQLLYNFVYSVPDVGAGTFFEALGHLIRYFVSRDLIISETFCRKFVWHSLMLWPEDMPRKAVISLAANDDLVPSTLIMDHLTSVKSSATIMYHPTAQHGGFLLDRGYQKNLVANIRMLLAKS